MAGSVALALVTPATAVAPAVFKNNRRPMWDNAGMAPSLDVTARGEQIGILHPELGGDGAMALLTVRRR